ncbi:uncharacterized protein B0H64DRAFT_421100 [Chaetomium fimeti]|uniref:Uncharacterized protein n=1 Tax=Chaetomium fimeti TaxID=1854472 RepID=A0AAE0H599_9PEZI|nr:hypothetical protein B0H64DRAFT_421100 [Chaetomium fimeti]
MSKPPRPAALRYSAEPAWIAAGYLVLLLVPWILTCILSSRTVRPSPENSGALTRETAQHLHRVSFAIDALNFIAAVAALPVIYALLARAAVVFSQRTNNRKRLNVKQLFALADRDFLSYGLAGNYMYGVRSLLFIFGTTLVFLVWNLGSVPRGLAIVKTRHALLDAFPGEWMAEAWHDNDALERFATKYSGRYFMSSLARDTTTGMYRQHALRMNSSSICDEIPASEVPVPCPVQRDNGLDTSYNNANLTVHVCVPGVAGANRGAPWNETEDRQDLTETLYITKSSPVYSYLNYTLRCVGSTSLGYFELGNSFNGGKFGPLLSSFKFPASTRDPTEFTDEVVNPSLYTNDARPGEQVPREDYNTEIARGTVFRAPGPLTLAAHAMFGAGSFFELAQSITGPNDTLSQTLCQLSPIPFQRAYKSLRRCDPEDTEGGGRYGEERGRFASRYGWANDRVEGLISTIRETNGVVGSLLDTTMYLASKATLDTAAVARGSYFGTTHQIWRADGIAVRTHVVSTAGLVVVTVLLGLQVFGILALVWYIYRMPTWTKTLDAMAVARITRQLADRDGGFLRSDALWMPTPEESRQMEETDALVGLVDHEVPEASDELTLNADASPAPDYILSVGAPGLISRGIRKAHKSEV